MRPFNLEVTESSYISRETKFPHAARRASAPSCWLEAATVAAVESISAKSRASSSDNFNVTGMENQINPSFILPSSLTMSWFQGGSHTISTSAASTPSNASMRSLASMTRWGPIPQPGAVRVIFTAT